MTKEIYIKYHLYIDEGSKCIAATTRSNGRVFKGVAKCNPEDEFDIAKGKEIAKRRCLQKLYKSKLKNAQQLLKLKEEFAIKVANNYRKYADRVDKIAVEYYTNNGELDALLGRADEQKKN